MLFESSPKPQNSPEEPNKDKKGNKWSQIKNKKIGLYLQNNLYEYVKFLFNLTITPKISEKDYKGFKKPNFSNHSWNSNIFQIQRMCIGSFNAQVQGSINYIADLMFK